MGRDLSVAATRYPAEGAAWATMVIAPAMGVRQEFYAPIAKFFSRSGNRRMALQVRNGARGACIPPISWAACRKRARTSCA